MASIQSILGYIVTIAGCPYVFTTGGVGNPADLVLPVLEDGSADPLWWANETGTRTADGWLFWPTGVIRSTARPLDGDVDIDPIRIRLHDAECPVFNPSTGAEDYVKLFTALATKTESSVVSSLLVGSLSATATTVNVVNGALFTINQFVWIDQEAMRVTAISTNALTVQRGRLGTKAVAHSASASDGLAPEVFAAMPWATKRKVCLWAVVRNTTPNEAGDTLSAKLRWVGFTGPTPALNEDGLTFDIVCTPEWNTIKDALVGDARGTLELSGANGLFGAQFWIGTVGISGARSDYGRFLTVDECAQTFVDRAVTAIDAASNVTDGSTRGFFRRDRSGAVFSFDFDTSVTVTEANNTMTAPPRPGTATEAGQAVNASHVDRGSNRHAFLFNLEYCPQVSYRFSLNGYLGTFGVRTMAPLDGIVLGTIGTAPGGRTLNYQTNLRCKLTDDWDVVFSDITSYGTSNYFTAHTTPVPRKAGLDLPPGDGTYWYLVDPPALQLITTVHADHWLDAIRYVVLPQLTQVIPEGDFDWSLYNEVIAATNGPAARRVWRIDGTRSLGKLFAETMLMNGCSLGVRNGRLAIVPWRLPDSNETSKLTINTDNELSPFNLWSIWGEGIANNATLRSEVITLNIQNDRSVRRWGRGRDLAIDMEGVEVERLRDLQPDELYRQVLSRMELWSSPVQLAYFDITAVEAVDLGIGDLITVNSFNAPNGQGTRGIVNQKARVLSIAEDMDTGKVTLGALLFGREAHGYAPCVKALDLDASTGRTVLLDPTPVQGAEDYEGSIAAGANTAGTTGFVAGTSVRPVYRDRTTVPNDEVLVLANNPSFNGTYWELTFTYPMSPALQTAVGNGEWVDFTFADYDHSLPPTTETIKAPYLANWGSGVLPTGFHYARTGTRLVISNTAQSALTSSAANTWVPEVDAAGNGHAVFTPGYTNTLTAPRQWANSAGNWQTGTVSTTSTTAGPDGTSGSGYRATVTGTTFGPYRDYGSQAVMAFSMWGRANSGSSSWNSYISNATGTVITDVDTTIGTTWERKIILHSTGRYVAPSDGQRPTAHSEDIILDCAQLVIGLTYAPPFTATTVGADFLYVPNANLIKSSGYFHIILTNELEAFEAPSTPTSDQYLWYYDANNHLRLRASDDKIVLTLGGSVKTTTPALSYASLANLGRLVVWNLASGCGFEFNSIQYTGTAGSTLSTSGNSYLFSDGNNASSVFPCRVGGYVVADETQTTTGSGPDRNYAWIGDDTTGVIGGTTDPNQRIAP